MTTDKRTALRALGKRRQDARWDRHKCIGDYYQGRYEHDEVSPYSKTAKNIDASLFLLLQDWASDDSLRQPFEQDIATLGYSPHARTNTLLVRLLREVFDLGIGDVYATNLFPFVKLGPISTGIPVSDLRRAAHEFARPQIDIVKPKLVICLGIATFRAMSFELRHPAPTRLTDAMAAPPLTYRSSQIWCQAHPAARGRPFATHLNAWKRMQHE